MVPPFNKVHSDDPWDDTDAGRAYWSEAMAIEDWIEAGAPDPMTMWRQLEEATDAPSPGTDAPPLTTAPNVREQGLANIEDARRFLGGMSRDTFERHVRRHVKVKHVGSRPYVQVDSLVAFCESNAFKALNL